ncbi:MAG: nuclear transport factor 2 family protein [Stagnimonas sp.]|nr:nuclear transport factor 2 family protein [Stagnimonas sp.]
MSLIRQFFEQRAAFEKTYDDGNWARLEPYFSESLVYEVMNMPFHCVIRGRPAVIAGLKRSIERFDKLCRRTVGIGAVIFQEGNNVLVHGGIRFQRGDSVPVESGLWEIATYRDGRIERLIDIYDPGDSAKYERWMAEWGDGLDASYT